MCVFLQGKTAMIVKHETQCVVCIIVVSFISIGSIHFVINYLSSSSLCFNLFPVYPSETITRALFCRHRKYSLNQLQVKHCYLKVSCYIKGHSWIIFSISLYISALGILNCWCFKANVFLDGSKKR